MLLVELGVYATVIPRLFGLLNMNGGAMNKSDFEGLQSLETLLKDYLNRKITLEILSRDIRLSIDSMKTVLDCHIGMMRDNWRRIEETNAVWLNKLERGITDQNVYQELHEEAELATKDFINLIEDVISVDSYWNAYARVRILAIGIISDYACLSEIKNILPQMPLRKVKPYDLLGDIHNKYYDSLCLKAAHLFGAYRRKDNKVNPNILGSHFKSLIKYGTDDVKDKLRFEANSLSDDDIGLERDFENTLLKVACVDIAEFEKETDNLKSYRDQVLAHIDAHPNCLTPISEIFYKLSCALIRCLGWISETNISGLRQVSSGNIDVEKLFNNVQEEFKEMIKSMAHMTPNK